jgi:hypothetical protein
MHVDGFERELHETRIQHKNLNMHNHSLSSKGIQAYNSMHVYGNRTNLEIRHQSQECIHSNENVVY